MNPNITRTRGGSRHTRSKSAEAKREYAKSVHAEAEKLVPHSSETAVMADRSRAFYEVYEGDGFTDENGETVITAPIVDKSITARQFLRIIPQRPAEVIESPGSQYDKTLRRMVQTTDQRVLRMSDRSLLKQGDPFKMPTDIKRLTSRSKRIIPDEDTSRYEPKPLTTGGTVDLDVILERADPPEGKRGRSTGRIL